LDPSARRRKEKYAGRPRVAGCMPYIDVIAEDEATGELAEIYADAKGRRGALSNVLKIHSLQPKTLKTHLEFYLSVLYGRSGLSRQERETIAVAVSHANACRYCIEHHADALSRYQKDPHLVKELATHGHSKGLTARESALVETAVRLTLRPAEGNQEDVGRLKQAGFSDEEILMATMTTAYFNFVNRMVHGLGVELENDAAADYEY
jgi:uncharacterized peroxidase-related enzyme